MIDISKLDRGFLTHVNETATSLLYELTQDENKQNPKEMNAKAPDGSPMPDSILGTSTMSAVDYQGRSVNRYFEAGDKYMGLAGESYQKANKLIHSCLKHRDINPFTTEDTILHELFWWIQACYIGEEHDLSNFSNHLIQRLNKLIKVQKVQIAISYLEVDEALIVGDVIFGRLTNEEFSLYDSIIESKKDEFKEQRVAEFHKFKKRYRIFTYATTNVEAEQSKAIEIATERIERALTILRFFSISAFDPEVPSYFSIAGENDVKISNILVTEPGKLPIAQSSLQEHRSHEWKIPVDQIHFFHGNSEFQALTALMMSHKPKNELEEILRGCLRLFGQAVRSQDSQLKIVFLLVALESLLLKDEKEAIGQGVSQKLAFLLEDGFGLWKERKLTEAEVKKIYGLRSRYLHHGKEEIELKDVKEFQSMVHQALINATFLSHEMKTKSDLITELEKRILS